MRRRKSNFFLNCGANSSTEYYWATQMHTLLLLQQQQQQQAHLSLSNQQAQAGRGSTFAIRTASPVVDNSAIQHSGPSSPVATIVPSFT
jgi:hypothetical protein